MEIAINEQTTRIVTVAPTGRIDAFSAPQVRAQFDQLMAGGATNFVVDLSNVTFLDSAGMAVLVTLLKRVRQRDGRLRLVWPRTDAARRVLTLTRMDRVFDMADTAEAAVSSF